MSWYRFRNGAIAREDIVSAPADHWDLNALYYLVFNEDAPGGDGGDKSAGDVPDPAEITRVGFVDEHWDRIIHHAGDVFYRLKDKDVGWGRPFNWRPGYLVGYRGESDQIIIACTLARLENQPVYTWRILPDKLDVSSDELRAFCQQIWQLDGMFLDQATYPALF